MTDLEKLVTKIQEAGQAWVDAKLKADQLQDTEKSLLASLMNVKEVTANEKISESKLERLARDTPAFSLHIKGKNEAIAEANKLKVRYEALQSLYEAKRSELAFEREKIAKGIYHSGK